MDTFDRGDEVRLFASFTNDDGDPSDPTSLTVRVLPPGGTEAVHVYAAEPDPEADPPEDVVQDETGSYSLTLTPEVVGRWAYRFEGVGALASVDESFFWVRTSAFSI